MYVTTQYDTSDFCVFLCTHSPSFGFEQKNLTLWNANTTQCAYIKQKLRIIYAMEYIILDLVICDSTISSAPLPQPKKNVIKYTRRREGAQNVRPWSTNSTNYCPQFQTLIQIWEEHFIALPPSPAPKIISLSQLMGEGTNSETLGHKLHKLNAKWRAE